VGLQIKPGEIYGLIGPNGAGKTTFFNVITGLYTPDSGEFVLGGKPYQPTAVHEVAKAGIARTFQNIRLFGDMTALENVMVGRHVRTKAGLFGAIFRPPAVRQEEEAVEDMAHDLLDYVGIGKYANFTSRNLSYGHQRRLEIARALATEPKLLALDEPAAGMNATEKVELRPAREDQERWQDHPADRARREAGDGLVQPPHRAGLRQGHRAGPAARSAEQSCRDRGLPRRSGALRRRDAMTQTILKISGLKVAYGGIQAVKGVDLESTTANS
jgi:ABC-type branched-subunit amino acid transport system ATPase component